MPWTDVVAHYQTLIYHVPAEELHRRLHFTMEGLLGQLSVALQSLRTLVTLAVTFLITYVSVIFGCVLLLLLIFKSGNFARWLSLGSSSLTRLPRAFARQIDGRVCWILRSFDESSCPYAAGPLEIWYF